MPFNHSLRFFVYVFLDVKTSQIKVGFSRDVERRRKALETKESRHLLQLWVSPYISTAREALNLEKSLHRQLSTYRIRGEWFSINAFSEIEWGQLTHELNRVNYWENYRKNGQT